MKSALFTRLSLLALSALILVPFASAQTTLAGEWQGSLDANGTTFRIAWHVTAAPDGKITSTFDNIDQNIYGIKVKTIAVKGSDITLSVDDVVQINGEDAPIKGDFTGTVSADGNEVNGTWTQTEPQQTAAQIHFKRAAAAAAQMAPSTAASAAITGDWAGTPYSRSWAAPPRAPYHSCQGWLANRHA
jgi:hypothetical protein